MNNRARYNVLAELVGVVLMIVLLGACSVKYGFNGASIDYTKTKTIQIADFPIRSSYVWGPMGPMFNNQLKDVFASHTRLQQVKRNGDLVIAGEITNYSQRNKSVSSEGYSAQTELSITVNVPVHLRQDLRDNTELSQRAGRTRHGDGQRPLRPDLQRYGS